MEILDERTLKVERSSKKAAPDGISILLYDKLAAVKPKTQVKPQQEEKSIEKKPFIPDPKVQTEKDVGTIAKFQGSKVKL